MSRRCILLRRLASWPAVMLFLLVGCNERPGSDGKHSPGTSSRPDSSGQASGVTLELFVGSATKPPVEEAAQVYENATGTRILLHFGGSGKMLAEMKLARRGDLYFPGSSDFMEMAKRERLVLPETERRVAYLIPAINVPAGNPKGIKGLEDLAKPGVRVGIARPDSVCVGLYAAEVLERNGYAARVKPNIVTHVESCEKTAQLVAIGSVDAILGWEVFHYWQPDKIETILLKPNEVPRIGYLPIAVSVFSKEKEQALKLIEFLVNGQGRESFRRWHYVTTLEEARTYALPDTPVGGEWRLPEEW